MVDVTLECTEENVPENKKNTTSRGGRSVLIGATCTKCGLPTGLPLAGTKFYCQTCAGAGDLHQDGDPCSELNRP
jgi:hypothetical protein